jgi:hypothetical protein
VSLAELNIQGRIDSRRLCWSMEWHLYSSYLRGILTWGCPLISSPVTSPVCIQGGDTSLFFGKQSTECIHITEHVHACARSARSSVGQSVFDVIHGENRTQYQLPHAKVFTHDWQVQWVQRAHGVFSALNRDFQYGHTYVHTYAYMDDFPINQCVCINFTDVNGVCMPLWQNG